MCFDNRLMLPDTFKHKYTWGSTKYYILNEIPNTSEQLSCPVTNTVSVTMHSADNM